MNDTQRQAFEAWASEEGINNFHFNHCLAAVEAALAAADMAQQELARELLETLQMVVKHFTRTPSTLVDSQARGNAHEVIAKAYAVMGYAAPITRDAATITFQQRVQPWMLSCFGAKIAADRVERNHRFFEEATEAVQANGMTRSEAHQLVDYTYDRRIGELIQEVGGVMVTLAALCLASGVDMHEAGEVELARISAPETMAKIRAKQAAKPKHSPLPKRTSDDHAHGAPYEWRDTGPLETEGSL